MPSITWENADEGRTRRGSSMLLALHGLGVCARPTLHHARKRQWEKGKTREAGSFLLWRDPGRPVAQSALLRVCLSASAAQATDVDDGHQVTELLRRRVAVRRRCCGDCSQLGAWCWRMHAVIPASFQVPRAINALLLLLVVAPSRRSRSEAAQLTALSRSDGI